MKLLGDEGYLPAFAEIPGFGPGASSHEAEIVALTLKLPLYSSDSRIAGGPGPWVGDHPEEECAYDGMGPRDYEEGVGVGEGTRGPVPVDPEWLVNGRGGGADVVFSEHARKNNL